MDKSVTGTFEPQGNAGGFLRDPAAGYRIGSADAFVTPELCRKLRLRGGETVAGLVGRDGRTRSRGGPVLERVDSVNDRPVDDYLDTKPFEQLTPIDPLQQIRFEIPGGSPSMRVIDLMTPIGLGQRGLICAPPRTGKTVLLQQMAEGVATNHPDAHLMMLLIDERPEEVTDMRRKVRGEVAASSNDNDATAHARLARLMIGKAKRLVETGRDVVILLDSLTRLGRCFNSLIRGGRRIMSGGLDANALIEPKAIFGAARNVEHGGSLTIIASALIETGSRMDEVIFSEFKGTGNMEIMLSRELADRRVWPAIDLNLSGTRKEELLLTPQALEASRQVHRSLGGTDPLRAMQVLLDQFQKCSTNAEFVERCAERPFR